ncbi:flagellar protein FlgJ [Tindallia magadiensis]|uniref:Flagellar protein FlgJ n=1 Tax=Tindallia magadiensis TaxID=69895 RepID=A0A1I3C5Z4_9FIRM|nr:rod-binding protein [Tindallia magadiensis]SFH69421.1 flagellar protein FlgJ [Tindallia magadiensis]
MMINEAMMRVQYQNSQPSVSSEKDMDSKEKERLMAACREFESIFLHMMIRQMRDTVPDNSLIEKSHAREIFEDLHDEELAKNMAKGQGIGLAQQMYQQLSRHVEPVKEQEESV